MHFTGTKSSIRELTCFKKLSQEHTVMLRSDFSRKAHASFQNFLCVYAMCFSSALTSNQRQFHVKLKSILNQIFIYVFL